MTYFARARRRGTLLPVRPELATTQSESDAASVCIISRQRLTGRITGSSTYLIDLVAALSQAGFVPHLLHPSPLIFGRTPIFRLTPDMDVFRTVDVRAGIKAGPWFIATNPVVWIEAVRGATALALQRLRLPYRWIAARPAPYSIAAPWTAQDKLYVARRAPAISRAGVVLDYLFQTDFASQGLNDTVGTVDGNTEAAKLSLADAVIAIQPADAAWVRQNVPGVAVLEAPFAATMSPCVQPGDDDVLLFVGSNTAPNIIGLTWFLDEIWPISFGGHAYKQVEFLGIVPDLGPVYAQSGIVISPLTLGSGLKVKLVEALGAGKACVVTSVTLQGVEDVTKSAVRLADTPTAFADAVLSMVADRTARADLAERALRCAREQFSTAGYVELIDWLTKGRRLEG
jgi:succinoglycan biosynthesis protein ExoO